MLNQVLINFVDFARTRINAYVVSRYMRDAGFTGDSSRNTTSTIRIQTGRLVRSITGASNEGIDEVTVANSVVTWQKGSRVPYALVNEQGFNGAVNVRAHTRVMNQAFGRPTATYTQQVSQHTRNMNIPARPFLSPAINDFVPEGAKYLTDNILPLLTNLHESN